MVLSNKYNFKIRLGPGTIWNLSRLKISSLVHLSGKGRIFIKNVYHRRGRCEEEMYVSLLATVSGEILSLQGLMGV